MSPTQFFAQVPGDPMYGHLLRGGNEHLDHGRRSVEQLWSRTGVYVGDDAPKRASREFHPVFWEMYLAAVLLDLNVGLVPRERRRFKLKGPDFEVGQLPVWIEATAVSAGRGPDAVTEAPLGQARDVPDDKIRLRLLAGIDAKAKRLQGYLASGLVGTDEPFVIAVSGGLVPSARLESSVPRIVRAVLGIGPLTLFLDRETLETLDSRHEYEPELKKENKSSVRTDLFHVPAGDSISALMYGSADVLNQPDAVGQDLILIHNPRALNRLPRGFIRRGREYWLDGESLNCVTHY